MINSIFALVLLVIAVSPVMADHSQFDYIEASRVIIKGKSVASSSNQKGYGVDAKKSFNEMVYVSGFYQWYEDAVSDYERFFVGAGLKHEVGRRLNIFCQIDYGKLKFSSPAPIDSLEQYRYGAGIYGAFDYFSYKIGLRRNEVNEKFVKDETTTFVELNYSLDNNYTVGLEVEITDYANLYNFTGRYHY